MKAITLVKSEIVKKHEEIKKITEMLFSKPNFETYEDASTQNARCLKKILNF